MAAKFLTPHRRLIYIRATIFHSLNDNVNNGRWHVPIGVGPRGGSGNVATLGGNHCMWVIFFYVCESIVSTGCI